MKKFVRRFLSFYLFFYCFPFPIGQLPGTDFLEEAYWGSSKFVAAWIGNHLLGIGPVYIGPTGSGDTPARYILVGVYFILALISTTLWKFFVRRDLDEKLHLWIYHYVRLTLACTLFSYGWAKITPGGQFGEPNSTRLIESFGDASPMGLLWTFMGSSRPYSIFAGLMEVIGSFFLVIPRFASLGAVVSAAVMTNVFMLNMCYDVPVKLYSFHLLCFSIFLLVPDMIAEKSDLVSAAAEEVNALRDSREISSKAIRLDFNTSDGSILTGFSKTDVSRVLANLVKNAADASPVGSVVGVVLMARERESRSYGKAEMLEDIKDPDHYVEFLKICIERDHSEDLHLFRKGLFLTLKAKGMTEAAAAMKIPRTTLYRMLWRGGNPNLRYLIKILHYLELRPWVVSEDFIYSSPTKRFRDETPDPRDIVPGRSRKIKVPKNAW